MPSPVVVVGGGPIGSLSALYAARRGYHVELYDLRDDPIHGDPGTRPNIAVIPLTVSERGLRAIDAAGVPDLLDDILEGSRPIHTRMVHTKDADGKLRQTPTAYSPQGQYLRTVERDRITKYIMLALMKEPNVQLHFRQKLIACDFEKKTATFQSIVWKAKPRVSEQNPVQGSTGNGFMPFDKTNEDIGNSELKPIETSITRTVEFEFLIGADGTHSRVRQNMLRQAHIDYSEKFIRALWCDLMIPSTVDGQCSLDPECLHMWPSDQRLIIAQPDSNSTFRAGMVCDTATVRYLEAHPEEFAAWFLKEFPGIIPNLLSPEEATRQFVAHQKVPLKSIKTGQLGYKDSAVLLGDSSHAMTPFYAMGMITGLEDVRIFFEQFRDVRSNDPKYGASAFCSPGTVAAYNDYRLPDVHAMVDLASEHYHELRIGTRSVSSSARKMVEFYLSKWAPWLGWTTTYARIQFGHERLTVIRRKEARQKAVIEAVLGLGAALFTAMILITCYNFGSGAFFLQRLSTMDEHMYARLSLASI